MDDCEADRQLETDASLRKIVADFEQLERAIDSVVLVLKGTDGEAKDVRALRRAKDAARKGAALAKSKLDRE